MAKSPSRKRPASRVAALITLDKAGVTKDEGVTGLDKAFLAAAGRRFYERELKIRNLA